MRSSISTDVRTYARHLDQMDPLRSFRSKFFLPKDTDGNPLIYFCGNSLGLQPVATADYINQDLDDWKALGVKGHLKAKHPWLEYHVDISRSMAEIVGGKANEVIVMNTLTVNLHLMMVSFYRPKGRRNKILIEYDAFPSDKYAVSSQIEAHGLDPDQCLIEVKPREGESCLRHEDIERIIQREGEEIALILLGNTNYYTGQFFDMQRIVDWGHAAGCKVGFDCAHGAGNVPLNLHDSGCDFAVWCTYKYLNSGPGSIAGCFVHERHAHDFEIPRYAGWWGHNKKTRFMMRDGFDPIPGIEGWQLSNPPIMAMAPIRASMDLFLEAGINRLREKSIKLTGFLEDLLREMNQDRISIITPANPKERGCQLSIFVKNSDKSLFDRITQHGVVADWREPGVIRVSPTPLYNTFEEVCQFVDILKNSIN